LVSEGNGTGQEANYYDPLRVFDKSGNTIHNYLKLCLPFHRNLKSLIDINHNLNSGFIANSQTENTSAGININYDSYPLEINGKFQYGKGWSDLTSSGNNYATILTSAYRTPISFDNQNGLSASDALSNSNSYLFNNGLQRNHAISNVDNPYWLINTMADRNEKSNLLTGVNIEYNLGGHVDFGLSLNYNKENIFKQFGLDPQSSGAPNGRFTTREQVNTLLHSRFQIKFEHNWDFLQLDASTNYIINQSGAELFRSDDLDLSSDINPISDY
jgi:hypothetical protein